MKRTVYYSRISIFLVVLILSIFAGTGFLLVTEHAWGAVITLACVLVLVLALLFSIRYVIEDTTLKIYVLCFHSDVDIRTITSMEPSYNPISSPAASLKRLKVCYGDGQVVFISPRKQDLFIEEIREIQQR